jgi:hypothetical protein
MQGLNDSHFDAVFDDFTKTLKELNIPGRPDSGSWQNCC